ncbi:hypothetical protein GCM10023189_07200 [Nibrella saemangeumensis]|uniref:AAA domain-containing protein n=1 Tax=Nibrella saemangeumensis TaxID=1084526 RepID=A0ABP8ME20_9BACT
MFTPDILKVYRKRLTNLSSRNRSLLLTSLPAEQFLDLHETDFLLNRPSFDLITQLIAQRPAIPICDVLDSRNQRVNEVSRKLRRIARTEQFIEEERGTWDLYVGYPFVRGKLMDGTVVHGPLLFFPVHLEQEDKQWQLTRRGDEIAIINSTIFLAYAHFNKVSIPDEYLEKDFTDFPHDALAFRIQLYEWLKASPLEINFNQELFENKLLPFDKQSLKNLDAQERTGELKLYPEAVLGIFPQAGSFLAPDYDRLIARAGRSQGPDSGTRNGAGIPFTAPKSVPRNQIREEHMRTPLPMDGSQEAAVRAVKAGQSLVVQGPPGTGKSQLIANLMADGAAQGRRVLLVCQKRAALDVVYNRLRQVGMEPFVALIHDFQNDRKPLYSQIATQIDLVDTYKRQNYSLDAVVMERDFDAESRKIDQLTAELQAFKEALFDTRDCGLSVKELYLTSSPNAPTIPLKDYYAQFRFDTLNNFLRKLTEYTTYRQRLPAEHLFAERVSFSQFPASALSAAEEVIRAIPETAQTSNQQTNHLIGRTLTLTEWQHWHSQADQLAAVIALLDGPEAERIWRIVRFFIDHPTHPARTTAKQQLEKLASSWIEALDTPGPETTLPPDELPAFRSLLDEARQARNSWVSWNWWQLRGHGKEQLRQVTAANALTVSADDLDTLTHKVEKRMQLESVRQQTRPLLTLSPALPDEPDSLRLLCRASEAAEQLRHLSATSYLPPAVWESFQSFTKTIRALSPLAFQVLQQQADWQTYLTDGQIEKAWRDRDYAERLRHTLHDDFDLLVDTDKAWENFSDEEQTIVDRLYDALPPAAPAENGAEAGTPEQVATLFQNALRLAWIEHIETKYPMLRGVSSLKNEQIEHDLQDSMRKKQALSRDMLLVKLREQTHKNLTFNRLNNQVTYRELLHQTTKRRNIWPVRKLMEQYADEIFKLVPCWMASPESVSAMFPLQEGLFDLVIFDEASQCFAESGLPAMFRGNQVVVTGDKQQLRPSDLYRIRFEEETNDETPVVLEVESLLDLAAQYLPQVSLTGHYRSRSLDLITFSNQYFYRNRLTLLPDCHDVNRHEPAIHYLKVNGTWQQNTNPVEAEKVLQLLEQLAVEQPGKSVGIVTFNYAQQQLIQERLDGYFHPEVDRQNPMAAGELRNLPLATFDKELTSEVTFVKNIENVQGDERDIIVFSLGYAPDESGRLAMQFGSLNAVGGENRLNVAITRARERIYIVTSLWPEQLNVEQTTNEGPKLLKAYLAYARQVAEGQFRPQPRPTDTLRSGALLKDKLTTRHPDWRPELPFADLTVKDGKNYKSLLLTDDDQYYQQSPKDAHAYTPFALRAKHWPHRRIYSREYWRGKI